MIEYNEWPSSWVDHYTSQRLVLRDPVVRWVYSHTGAIRWSDMRDPDRHKVFAQAAQFGLHYGAAVACRDKGPRGLRSFGVFARPDREFENDELNWLLGQVEILHAARKPPQNLTKAELVALRMVRDGLRHKEIAYELGVSEGAIKQRLRNAKLKLDASTAAQAASIAKDYGLL